VEPAVNTDRLFGRILAEATLTIFKQARKDGLREDLPICLGGKPSYARCPILGRRRQSRIGAAGIMSYLRPSVIDERGFNANLVGGGRASRTHGGREVGRPAGGELRVSDVQPERTAIFDRGANAAVHPTWVTLLRCFLHFDGLSAAGDVLAVVAQNHVAVLRIFPPRTSVLELKFLSRLRRLCT